MQVETCVQLGDRSVTCGKAWICISSWKLLQKDYFLQVELNDHHLKFSLRMRYWMSQPTINQQKQQQTESNYVIPLGAPSYPPSRIRSITIWRHLSSFSSLVPPPTAGLSGRHSGITLNNSAQSNDWLNFVHWKSFCNCKCCAKLRGLSTCANLNVCLACALVIRDLCGGLK